MVDPINLKTTLSQTEIVQRMNDLRQKEHDNAQKHFANEMNKETVLRQERVNTARKTEQGKVDERKEGSQQKKDKENKKRAAVARQQTEESDDKNTNGGSHIDIKV
jgi:hypothetical protein